MATITGTAGNDTLFGKNDADLIQGLDGDDVLGGRGGDDQLEGGEGSDRLNGALGADLMIGGAGDDLYFADDLNDNVIEDAGGGNDRVIAAVENYVLRLNVETLTLGAGIIRGTGNALAETLIGNDEDNWLNGAGGADTLYGGYGNDTYIVDDAGDMLMERLTGGRDRALASVTYTLGDNIEDLTLTGNAAIDGTGNALGNRLVGNSADNVLDGGGAADVMVGQGGDDTYIVDHPGDRVAEGLNQGNDTVRSAVSFILSPNIENLILTGIGAINGIGNDLANTITGNDADNLLRGNGGDDMLIGGGGLDIASYTHAAAAVSIDLNFDVQSNTGGDGTDTYVSIEGARGSKFDDTLTGDDGVNFLHGDAGDDTINGGLAGDTLFGGAGQDVMDGGGGHDTLDGHLGNDILHGGAFNDTLYGGAGDDTIDGGDGIDHGYGGDGNDNVTSYWAYGEAGDDTVTGYNVYGGTGNDTLYGSRYWFNTPLDPVNNVDHMPDFNNQEPSNGTSPTFDDYHGDLIRLSSEIFGAAVSNDHEDRFHVGTQAADAEDRIIYDQPTGRIFYDPDGTGAEEQVLFATVTPGLWLSPYHFEVY